MADLIVSGLTRDYGAVRAVNDVSFTVRDGEFLTLLGPSGCGKSTTLFSIAGLDRPSAGRIAIGDGVYFDAAQGINLAPEQRNCGLVFQSYALWPHMTVRSNVEFPLRLRKVSGAEARTRVDEALALVEMGDYAARWPHELSGGQQQRVALARTLVYQPEILLLDEPLSNLDAKLRLRARGWLRELQTRLKITTVYVTHDQEEALALSDRIAVMNGGRIVQLGTPREIYQQPRTAFVADFVGHSNLLPARAEKFGASGLRLALADGQSLELAPADRPAAREVQVAIRPEHVEIFAATESPGGANLLRARVLQRDFLGAHVDYIVETGGGTVRIISDREVSGTDVLVRFPAARCMLFTPEPAA
jgi:iron(III) transport system ATP-binding protein